MLMTPMQCCACKYLTIGSLREKKLDLYVVFANFPCVNTSTMVDFKLPTDHHWTQS